ncbi:MAG: chemotaxis protein CheB [Gammaproteobacteria bacterium]|nr:MAG: chemotaxis protein CheB [Gammaproteobacteria bacterium]
MSNALHVMLVGESAEQLAAMQELFKEYGHLTTQVLAEQLSSDAVRQQADLWVVEISDEDRAVEAMELLMDSVERPVVFGEGFLVETGEDAWRHRMLEKLDELDEQGEIHWLSVPSIVAGEKAQPRLQQAVKRSAARAAEPYHVWVLAASTGGPHAVKEFLDQLPSGLPVAFIYVQHINKGFEKLLVKVLGKDNSFRFNLCGEAPLKHGQVSIVPVEHQVLFGADGRVATVSEPWSGLYSPSINRVMENIAEVYGKHMGTIVFTGMGDDGKAACAAVHAAGGRVWAQDAATSTISSMPDSARASGAVELSGTPAELAQALVRACA